MPPGTWSGEQPFAFFVASGQTRFMSALRYDRLLCIDLELTCWVDEPPIGMRREIIEIGIVEADPRSLEILREDRYLVRPRSEVSAYCTALTGLTDSELRRNGRPLVEVLRTLVSAYGTQRKATLAWGSDWSAIERDCTAAGIPNPFPGPAAINLGQVYMLMTGATQRPSVARALEELGLEFDGRPHGALVDARNTIAIYREMALRMRMPQPAPANAFSPAP